MVQYITKLSGAIIVFRCKLQDIVKSGNNYFSKKHNLLIIVEKTNFHHDPFYCNSVLFEFDLIYSPNDTFQNGTVCFYVSFSMKNNENLNKSFTHL